MEFFLHPWYMAAGGALVSLPILIHLINRMRFKRVRWAAMEFLLKSQKRNRRRLIIEQLILLGLRILLVLLAGVLVSRFKAWALDSSEGATHLVVLDDTLSMADRGKENPKVANAFEEGKEQIKLLIKSASQARSPQQMRVVLLSDLNTILYDQRLNDRSADDVGAALASRKPTLMHVDPIEAVQKAQNYFNDVKKGQKILHLVSDFREGDWATGAGVEKLTESIEKLLDNKTHLSLIDTAAPYRAQTRQVAVGHDNLSIVDLKAERRVAAEGVPIEFTVTIENFSSSDAKTFLTVRVDGQEDFAASQPIEKLPASQRTEHKFTLLFAKKKPSPEVRENDPPDERERKRRLDREFVQITAEISAEPVGLSADNVRDMVIEVRKKVPTLVVDGNGPESQLEKGDLFHLKAGFAAARSAEVERIRADDLERTNLELYPSIIFLNLAEIKNVKVLDKLKDYVSRGGSIAYFMGDKVKPTFYNETLFKKYNGLFPLLIGDRPYNPIDPTGTLSEEDRDTKRKERLYRDEQPKILFRDPEHPMVAGLFPSRSAFRFLGIDLYYKAQPRSTWDPEPRQAEEIIVLPNTRSIDDYKGRSQELARQADELTEALAGTDPEYKKYVEPVKAYRRDVTTALTTPYLFNLVRALDVLLNDPGEKDDAARPNMPSLWAHPKMKTLAADIKEFRETVLYGDPLVVARRLGKGRVVAVLTSAGTAAGWNDWGSGSPVSWSYPVFIMELQRYLTSEGDDLNRVLGEDLTFHLDATRYQPKVKRVFQPQPDFDAAGNKPDKRPTPEDQGEQSLSLSKNVLTFHFADARRPGVYTFEFFPLSEGGAAGQTETRSYAFNVDAANESNLRRAVKEKLEGSKTNKDPNRGVIALRSPGSDYEVYKERQPDASEFPWLYLFFLLVLIVEQALAVHLSFHLKGNEAVLPTPGTRSQPAAA
jgi:hypothetical protein